MLGLQAWAPLCMASPRLFSQVYVCDMCVYVCVCSMYVVHMYACVCVCVDLKLMSSIFSSYSLRQGLLVSTRAGTLITPRILSSPSKASQTSLHVQPASTRVLGSRLWSPYFQDKNFNYRVILALGFLHRGYGWSSGPDARMAGILPADLSPEL